MQLFDILIIGAGVIGASIARNLSKYNIKIAVVEKEADVSLGASKANSGIVHGGYAGKSGTLKGELCIKGNQMYDQLDLELNFGFKRIGGMILGFNEHDREVLERMKTNGQKVGQDDFVWLDKNALHQKEPHISESAQFALYMPSIGVTSPYELTIALIENAIDNGVKLFLEHEVLNIKKSTYYTVETSKGLLKSKYIINAAGINSGKFNDLFNDELTIHPRRGQYILFGKDQHHLVNHVLFQPPTDKGKGTLVTQTYHGNFMIGPDAEDLLENPSTDTHVDRIEEIIKLAKKSIPGFNIKRALTTFSGIRAMASNQDFYIKEVNDRFITVGGIDSPGLTSAPAIAEYVIDMIKKKETLSVKKKYQPKRVSYFVDSMDDTVCYCEEITIKEIESCFDRGITIHSTDAVKRRVRAGMGNCQGTRCQPVVKSMIMKKYHLNADDVTMRTEKSEPKKVSIQEIRKLKV